MSLLMTSSPQAGLRVILLCFVILSTTTTILVCLFGPRIYALYFLKETDYNLGDGGLTVRGVVSVGPGSKMGSFLRLWTGLFPEFK